MGELNDVNVSEMGLFEYVGYLYYTTKGVDSMVFVKKF